MDRTDRLPPRRAASPMTPRARAKEAKPAAHHPSSVVGVENQPRHDEASHRHHLLLAPYRLSRSDPHHQWNPRSPPKSREPSPRTRQRRSARATTRGRSCGYDFALVDSPGRARRSRVAVGDGPQPETRGAADERRLFEPGLYSLFRGASSSRRAHLPRRQRTRHRAAARLARMPPLPGVCARSPGGGGSRGFARWKGLASAHRPEVGDLSPWTVRRRCLSTRPRENAGALDA